MEFIKKQTIGTWITVLTFIFGIVAFITYNLNVAGEGYFHGKTVDIAVTYMLIGIIMTICAIILAQIPVTAIIEKILSIVSDLIRIAVPALFIAAILAIISDRVEGFAFIYFSNEEVLQEVQTAANLSSAHGAIANIVLLGVAALVGIIGAFFSTRKANK